MSQTETWDDIESGDSLESASGIDILAILQRRKWIVLASVVLGIAAGYLYYSQADPVYKSRSRILIERRGQPLPLKTIGPNAERMALIQDAIKHPLVFTSPTIVGMAVEDFQLGSLASFRDGASNPVSAIIRNVAFEAANKGGTGPVYDVTLSGPNADDLPEIVHALVETYRKFLDVSYQDVNKDTRELIFEAKEDLLSQLAVKEDEYEKFRQAAPLMWQDGEARNLHQDRQSDIEGERSSVLLQISELKSHLENALAAIETGNNIEALKWIAESVRRADGKSDPELRATELLSHQSSVLPLLLEQHELTARYGPDHPRVKSIERRIRYMKDFYRDVLGFGLDGASVDGAEGDDAPESGSGDLVETYLGSLRLDLSQLEQRLVLLNELFKEEEQISKEFAVHQAQDETHRNEIARSQQLFEAVVKSLEEISLVKESTGHNFQTLAVAGRGRKTAPMAPKIFAVASVLGALAGIGIAYLVDLADQSFRSPEEIAKQLGLPVVGHVPLFPELDGIVDGSPLAPGLITVHQPRSAQAEAYRSIRTALFFNARGHQHQLIQITSPTPGDGKSTLSANLATTIANSGKSVLLIDGDLRKPTQHELFGLSTEMGLSSVVHNGTEPADAYQPIEGIENLTVITSGPRPDNPSELLSSIRFRECLDYLREQFDFVIVDSPPLLAVSEASAVAGQVDGVLLTMRVNKHTRSVARRACNLLREIGADIVGVVVNGVMPQKGGHGYGGYGYGNYGYGYGSGYGYGEVGSVYGESDQTDHEVAGNGRRKPLIAGRPANGAATSGNGSAADSVSKETV